MKAMIHLGEPEIREQIVRRLTTVRPELRPVWGRMSAHQMICHLSDSFQAAMGQRYASPSSGFLANPAFKWVALYAPFRWPKGVPTRPEVDQTIGGTPPGDFVRDRASLVELIGSFTDPARPAEFASHPLWGAMRKREWLRWGYLHTDHHLRQFGV